MEEMVGMVVIHLGVPEAEEMVEAANLVMAVMEEMGDTAELVAATVAMEEMVDENFYFMQFNLLYRSD
jgi:hypothetical protein